MTEKMNSTLSQTKSTSQRTSSQSKSSVAAGATVPSARGPPTASAGKIAAVLVRGIVDVRTPIKDTLQMLRLRHKNHCVILADTPIQRGMLVKVKDYVTWGVISESTFRNLLGARGQSFQSRPQDSKQKYSYKYLEVDGKKYKPYFRLNPPRKGFGRKGIKVAFRAGGALGDRGDKMSDLLERML